ncbi:hypothetical protein QBC43DRAFT_322911 [Cladorrhinum sp. PSN259]|nr:hypothetical protein QBC43DRAFT_322911 [Cladorrhinum sp. PSN259]
MSLSNPSQNSQMPPPPLPTRLSQQPQQQNTTPIRRHSQLQKLPSSSPRTLLLAKIHKHKKNKPDPPEVIAARYARLGVTPPPKLTNQLRFTLFIERINRRQFAYVSNVVNHTLTFNDQKISLYELTLLLKNEWAPEGQLKIVEMVGGRVFPNPPERDVNRYESDPLMARVVVKMAGGGEEGVKHLYVDFNDGKISAIHDIREEMPRRKKKDGMKPRKAVPVPREGRWRRKRGSELELEDGRLEEETLEEFYRAYVACINSGPEGMRAAAADGGIGKYVSEKGVKRNGVLLEVDRYTNLMVDAMDAVEGLKFDLKAVVVDEERQMIAARLEFAGTPVKTFQGAVPTGEEVEWAEHVFYWLDKGKIAEVLSVVDWETYREGLGQ